MSRGRVGKGGAFTWFESLIGVLQRAVGRVSVKGTCVKEAFTALCTVLPWVRFLLCVVFPMSHLMHFHLTRLFAHLLTYVFPMSPQAFMDFQV